MRGLRSLIFAVGVASLPAPVLAQVSAPLPVPLPITVHSTAAPVTKLEGFRAVPGAVLTQGFEELGRISGRIVVELRQVKDSLGNSASGVAVQMAAGGRKDWAFVDADELPALLKGLDALLLVYANPTTLKNFEVRFTTRDGLSFVAYNSPAGPIEYSLESGGPLPLPVSSITAVEMTRIREWLELAVTRLGAPTH